MARLKILQYPDPRLRLRALPVTDFGAPLQRLADDLIETLRDSGGIGLAAPQVGIALQAIVIDVSPGHDEPRFFANPQLIGRAGPGIVEESCLSVPGVVENVRRYTRVRVRACQRDGSTIECELDGLEAVCLLHELDHLQGKLFIDRLGFYKRLRVRRRLAALQSPAAGKAGDVYANPSHTSGVRSLPSQPAEASR